jgi:hypothetical protein
MFFCDLGPCLINEMIAEPEMVRALFRIDRLGIFFLKVSK